MNPSIAAAPARRRHNRYALIAMLALVPGIVAFGFRAAIVVVVVLCTSALGTRWLRQRGRAYSHAGRTLPLDALLLAALLPAEFAGGWVRSDDLRGALWPALVAAGFLLAMLRYLRSARPWPVFDPVVVCVLLLHLSLGIGMHPQASLNPNAIARGDVLRASIDALGAEPTPWYGRSPIDDHESARATPWAAAQLDAYVSGKLRNTNLDSLIRDALPPIEDLILLGHPMPIGLASGVTILALVLWGAFHRAIDWRIPLTGVAACYVTLMILPVPASVSTDGAIRWRIAAAWQADIGPATALTFIHYLLFASPTLFLIGLVAPRGDVRPVQQRALMPWSFGVGIAIAAAMIYISVIVGPLVVMLFAPAAARACDRIFAARPLLVAT